MFSNFNPFLETLITSILGYISIILLLRISGKRTLSKWNSFDFIVTIALGSVLASVLLSTKDAFGKGILAFALLVIFQYIISWASVRFSFIQKLIKAEPALLLYQGEMWHEVMKQERVAEGEILAALRSSGISAIEDVGAVILETDGSFSVIKNLNSSSASSLKNVREFDRIMMTHSN